jgi:hypothetical protein
MCYMYSTKHWERDAGGHLTIEQVVQKPVTSSCLYTGMLTNVILKDFWYKRIIWWDKVSILKDSEYEIIYDYSLSNALELPLFVGSNVRQ